MKENEEEFDEEEYRRIIEEYENSLEEYDDFEDDFRDLNTGICALDRTYIFDKRVEKLVDIFDEAISFIEEHTDLPRDEIINRINSKIIEIELADGYKDNQYGIGNVDNVFNILSVNVNILEEDKEIIYEFIRHEMTHMLSGELVKKFWQKRPTLISGYSREDVFDFEIEEPKKENEYFNEAVVEMFAYQDEDYREEEAFGHTVYTNQDFNEGYYAINSNIIRQMMLARGIDKNTLFRGLYDRNTARKVEKSFDRKVFKELSRNMDDISNGIYEYWSLEDSEEDGKENQELDSKIQGKKRLITDKIKSSEKMVIDKILMPRLNKLSPEKREELLSEYDKFLICERDYFRQRTHYQAVAKPVGRNDDKPWLKRVEVDVNEVLEKQGEKRTRQKATYRERRKIIKVSKLVGFAHFVILCYLF